ncbi:MAG: class I SAM-dependent methyltransferase [Candidatus Omnitrophica bacterium]|nr:class I SAM-dependent methyltransferase [Candidatus Omnitrophota bacterium]
MGEDKEIRKRSAPGIHEKVIELLKDKDRGRLLDAGAGEGILSYRLKQMGFEVYTLDIDDSFFKIAEVDFKKSDLNQVLPYKDEFFDYIICVEVIEHLQNTFSLIREFYRILKPKGKLVITTPNIQNLLSRVKFFLFGSFCYFNSKIDIKDTSLSCHINPVSFSELEMILSRSKFRILEITTNRIFFNSISTLLILGFDFLNKHFNKAYNPKLQRKEILLGEILIILACKE